ncbi:unnamed protein product, partial [Didymodactylos carnosus]
MAAADRVELGTMYELKNRQNLAAYERFVQFEQLMNNYSIKKTGTSPNSGAGSNPTPLGLCGFAYTT